MPARREGECHAGINGMSIDFGSVGVSSCCNVVFEHAFWLESPLPGSHACILKAYWLRESPAEVGFL